MRLVRGMRTAAAGGAWLSVGCLYPLVLIGLMFGNLAVLFGKMGWPMWIVWVLGVLFWMGGDGLFAIAYAVGIVAGFFHKGVWPWSLAAIGIPVVGRLLWVPLLALASLATPELDEGTSSEPIIEEPVRRVAKKILWVFAFFAGAPVGFGLAGVVVRLLR